MTGDHRHECPAPRCTIRVPDDRLACRGHWFALPKIVRNHIWATYVPGQDITTASPAYLDALKEAEAFWGKP